ncbi:MAG TPA: sensor histidine kinase [Actinomycetota bacterium]|nr:sensor histidine kinase [Actinomycetota bacterium]
MTQRTASRLAWSLWGAAIVLLIANLVLSVRADALGDDGVFAFVYPVFLLAFATVGALIAARQPGNAIGWVFIGTGLAWAVLGTADAYAAYALATGQEASFAARAADWVNIWFYGPGIFLPVTLLLLLFPDGRVPSPRWRPVLWIAIVGNVGVLLGNAFDPGTDTVDARFLTSNPFGVDAFAGVADILVPIAFFAALGSALAAPFAMGLRLRRSHGDERRQLQWLAAAGVLVVFAITGVIVVGSITGWAAGSTAEAIGQFVVIASLSLLPIAAGIAILRYRLYDIDVVINKTVVYGLLAAIVTAIYVAIVVGIGTLVGSGGGVFLSAVAAAVVALLFQPLRRRAQHLANRVVYGTRATPYEVLAGFSERLGDTYSLDDVLPRVARVLGEGVGAERVAILLGTGTAAVPVASWPAGEDPPGSDDLSFEVRHQGDVLGEIRITMPSDEAMGPSQERLATDVAAQAGLVLRNAALVADLRESRRRIVAAQDERARKLERNIHDGAQQQLVALSVKLGLVERMLRTDASAAEAMVAEAKADTNDALENLRDLARGVYPPLLADQGLAAALRSQARKAAIPVEVEPDGIGRYPEETEAAVYFSCLEALQNVAKYAAATSATVRLAQSDGSLVFEVIDDGRGFDPEAAERGSGLQGIADRLAALGGTLAVRSSPGRGTTIAGSLPVEVTT